MGEQGFGARFGGSCSALLGWDDDYLISCPSTFLCEPFDTGNPLLKQSCSCPPWVIIILRTRPKILLSEPPRQFGSATAQMRALIHWIT